MISEKKVLETERRFKDILEKYNCYPPALSSTSSFGEYSAPFLYFKTTVLPEVPVIFIDTGFLTKETYAHKRKLEGLFDLDIRTFMPKRTAADLEAEFGELNRYSIQALTEVSGYNSIRYILKKEPYERALQELNPASLVNGLQKDKTPQREHLKFTNSSPKGLFQFCPLFDWTSKDLYYFCTSRGLPINSNHVDICKEDDTKECGMHTVDFQI